MTIYIFFTSLGINHKIFLLDLNLKKNIPRRDLNISCSREFFLRWLKNSKSYTSSS